MKHSSCSGEYPATVPGVKRGLKVARCSQRKAALGTDQSPALVSMVLSRQMKSQPCLDKLAAFINALVVSEQKPEKQNGRPTVEASRTA